MESYFRLKENGTTIKKEVIGGLTTFLTMAYIIIVNPSILSAAFPQGTTGALLTATCLAAAFATILMGVYANLPFGLASGMGLNAFFAYTVCGILGVSWQVALTAVLIEGIIFIILTATKVREMVVNAIPKNLKLAVSAGIGLFIAFIGFGNAGIVVSNEATKVAMGSLTSPTALIAIFGIIVIVVLEKKGVKGAILWGILSSAIISWIFALVSPEEAAKYLIFAPNGIFKFESIRPIAFKFALPENPMTLVTIVITFLFVDFFDTVGTLVGVATKANMFDEKGNVRNASKALMVDAIGTTAGAMMGTSTVTTYVESSAGVADGARTGLASVVTGLLFLVAMFFSPILTAVPGCATAPALIVVGFYMIQSVTHLDLSDITEGVPVFLTIALMPLTYSIGDGLTWGIMSYGILNFLGNLISPDKKKKVSPVIYILTLIFILKIIFLKVG